jgi:hypothetical protein
VSVKVGWRGPPKYVQVQLDDRLSSREQRMGVFGKGLNFDGGGKGRLPWNRRHVTGFSGK